MALKYNPATRKMEQVEDAKTETGDAGPITSFMVKGKTLDTLLKFAGEDSLDISTKTKRGQAVNSYVSAACDEFISARGAVAAPAKTS